jgi:hypothetical protein
MKTNSLLFLMPFAWLLSDVAATATQQSPNGPTWRQSQESNNADAYRYARFTLVGTFLSPPPNAVTTRPAVVVDCVPAAKSPRGKGTFLDGKLLVGMPLKIVYVEPSEILEGMSYFPKVAVQLHTDTGKDTEGKQWSPGSDRTSAVISKHSLQQILRAHTVGITAEDENGNRLAMQFDIPDPGIVDDACHLSAHR